MKKLTHPDTFHLEAAHGWLELGNHLEANAELEQITPKFRVHPDVLEARVEIYFCAKLWPSCIEVADTLVRLEPKKQIAWIHRSFALHELRRTQEAFDSLLPAAAQFPENWTVPYNLACYCAQLNQLEEAKSWFTKAMAVDSKTVQQESVDDPDLKPLWDSMSGTMWRKE